MVIETKNTSVDGISKEMTTEVNNSIQTVFLLWDKHIGSFDPKSLKEHPLSKELFDDLPQDEYDSLKTDIKERGIQDALHIVRKDSGYVVVSGHQRRKIAIELGIKVPCIIRDDLKEEWQIEEQLILDNLLRRHLTDYQIGEVGKHLEPIEAIKAKNRQGTRTDINTKYENGNNIGPNLAQSKESSHIGEEGRVREIVADKIGVKHSQYTKIKTVRDKAPADIKKQWKENKISTHTAYTRTKKYERKQEREKIKKEKETTASIPLSNDNIKNMDCLDFLATIEDNSVNLILTDPPYEISRDTGFVNMSENGVDRLGVSMDFGKWDKNFKNLEGTIEEFYRVLKPTGTLIIFYDLWKITKMAKILTDAGFKQLRFIEWIKTNPVPLNSKLNYLTNAREIAITAVKKSNPTFHSEYDNGVYSYPIFQNGERIHPTQKPTTLFEALIKKHTNKNELVIDTFLGSGTTAIAARNTERKFRGCEIDEKYYNAILKRLGNGKEFKK